MPLCAVCEQTRPGSHDASGDFFCNPCRLSYYGTCEDAEDYAGKAWHDEIIEDDDSADSEDFSGDRKLEEVARKALERSQKKSQGEMSDESEEDEDQVADLPVAFASKHASLFNKASSSQLVQTHVIVLVDTSGSMRTIDVQHQSSSPLDPVLVPRIEAVRVSLSAFFEKQHQSGSPHKFSLISFNEQSRTHFVRKNARQAVQHMKHSKGFFASHGTHFVQSLEATKLILNRQQNSPLSTHLLIFSDGRPADGVQMIRTVQAMLEEHPSLRIHAIGFGDGLEFEWLQQLTSFGRGIFAPAARSIVALNEAFTSVTSTITKMQTVSSGSKSSAFTFGHAPSSEENSSQSTSSLNLRRVIFEPPNQFLWGQGQGRSTSFEGSRRWFHFDGFDFKESFHRISGKPVWIRLNPFMQGGMRLVYCFKDPSMPLHFDQFGKSGNDARMVAKISKYEDSWHNSFEVVSAHAKSSAVARYYSHVFESAAGYFLPRSMVNSMAKIVFLRCYVYRADENEEGRVPASLMVGERFLPGAFLKYNSNHGYVNTDASDSELAQAFSHFTFVVSGGQHMVLDLQGVHLGREQRYRPHLILTDPQVVSIERTFGPGDLGNKGMQAFFQTHKCGITCKKLGIDKYRWKRMRQESESSEPGKSPVVSVATNSGSISSLRNPGSEASRALPSFSGLANSYISEPEVVPTPSKPAPTLATPNPGKVETPLAPWEMVKPSSEVSAVPPSESALEASLVYQARNLLGVKPDDPLSARLPWVLKPSRPPDDSSEVSTVSPSESAVVASWASRSSTALKPDSPFSETPRVRVWGKTRRPPDYSSEVPTVSPSESAVGVSRSSTQLRAKPDGPLSAIMARSPADSKRPDYDSLLRGRRAEPEQPARSALQAPGSENGGAAADAGRKASLSDVASPAKAPPPVLGLCYPNMVEGVEASPAKAPPPAFGLCYPNMVEGVEASRAKAPPPPLGPCYPNMVEGVEASRAKAPPPPLGPCYPNMVEGVEASRAKAPPPPLGQCYPNMVEGVEARPAKAPPFKAPPLKAPPAMGLGHPSAATTLAETTKQALGG